MLSGLAARLRRFFWLPPLHYSEPGRMHYVCRGSRCWCDNPRNYEVSHFGGEEMTTTELLRDKIRQREDSERDLKQRIEDSSVVLAAHFAPVRAALNELHRDGVLIQVDGKTVVFPEVVGSGCRIEFSGDRNFPHVLYSDRTRYILMDTRTTRYYDHPEEAVEAFLESMLPYFRAAKASATQSAHEEER